MTDMNHPRRCSTGIHGLGRVPGGGQFPIRADMLIGDPGTGTMTSGLHSLTNGQDPGESSVGGSRE